MRNQPKQHIFQVDLTFMALAGCGAPPDDLSSGKIQVIIEVSPAPPLIEAKNVSGIPIR